MTSWDVDDRPATPYTRLYVRRMWRRRDKEAFEGAGHTLQVALEKQRQGDAAPTPWTRLATSVTASTHEGMRVWTAWPRRGRPVARVVYLHGGGYVHPLTPDYWRLVRALAGTPAEVVVPAYPLAPDATAGEVVPRLVRLVASVGRRDPDLPVVVMGDSAGGALALVVAQLLREEGVRPAAVVPLCPWLDATLAEESVAHLEASDPMLAESGLRAAGRSWSGRRRPDDPWVSPLNGSLAGLPPIEVFIGDRDILRPAVDELAARADAEGADLCVHETPAMFHVWMTRAIPEGRRTRRRLADLVRRHGGA